MPWLVREFGPQGLKPAFLADPNGTAESRALPKTCLWNQPASPRASLDHARSFVRIATLRRDRHHIQHFATSL